MHDDSDATVLGAMLQAGNSQVADHEFNAPVRCVEGRRRGPMLPSDERIVKITDNATPTGFRGPIFKFVVPVEGLRHHDTSRRDSGRQLSMEMSASFHEANMAKRVR